MGVEVPPFKAAFFRADALTGFEFRYFSRSDAESIVIRGPVCQPKVAILAAMHESGFSWHGSIVWPRN
jgi:hypothetical protein